MSMKPVHQRGHYEGRDALWGAIRELKRFTITQVADETSGYHRSSVSTYIKSLVAAGYLEVETQGLASVLQPGKPFEPVVYKLVKDAIEPPRVRRDGTHVTQGLGRDQMWRVMRILKRFILEDLIAASNTQEHKVSKEEAKTYCRYLVKAGYLRKEGKAYIHIRYTGPKSPQVQKIRQVWDPNLKEVVWPRRGER